MRKFASVFKIVLPMALAFAAIVGETSHWVVVPQGGKDAWHTFINNEVIGPFSVVNAPLGVTASDIAWTADYGTMNPTNGFHSWLTVGNPPVDVIWVNADITTNCVSTNGVTSVISTNAVVTTAGFPVPRCDPGPFRSVAPNNFAPAIGETIGVGINFPGCAHYDLKSGFLDVEVMRLTLSGWQHVAWITNKMDVTTILNNGTNLIWNGKADVDLNAEDAAVEKNGVLEPIVFRGFRDDMNLLMPAVHKGRPVPPADYTIFVRYKPQNAAMIVEPHKISVQQVFKVKNWNPAASAKTFSQEVKENNPKAKKPNDRKTLLEGFDQAEAARLIDTIPSEVAACFPGVNIRIIPDDDKVLIAPGAPSIDYRTIHLFPFREGARGEANLNPRNEDPGGRINIFLGDFPVFLQEEYEKSKELWNEKFAVPITKEEYLRIIVVTIAHEIAHSLGLVDKKYQPVEWEKDVYGRTVLGAHNKGGKRDKMMDIESLRLIHRIKPFNAKMWRDENLKYMQFILTKPGTVRPQSDQTLNNEIPNNENETNENAPDIGI